MVLCQDLTLAAAADGQAQHLTMLFVEYFWWLTCNVVMPIQTARPVGITLNTAFQDSDNISPAITRKRKNGDKGNAAYLQSCDANPDSQASGHDTDNGFPGVAVTIEAAQLACQPERQIGQTAGAPGSMPCIKCMR